MDYDTAKISDFVKDIPNRIDGWALILATVSIGVLALAPVAGFPIGTQRIGKVDYSLVWFMPAVSLLYCHLVFFSSSSIRSRLMNSLIIIATPMYLFYSLIEKT